MNESLPVGSVIPRSPHRGIALAQILYWWMRVYSVKPFFFSYYYQHCRVFVFPLVIARVTDGPRVLYVLNFITTTPTGRGGVLYLFVGAWAVGTHKVNLSTHNSSRAPTINIFKKCHAKCHQKPTNICTRHSLNKLIAVGSTSVCYTRHGATQAGAVSFVSRNALSADYL